MYFCQDIDLLSWEPAVFLDPAFGHQRLVLDAPATLTGTALVTASPVLAHVAPGMVASAALADDSLTQLLEIVFATDASHATLSALRGHSTEAAIPPLTGGSVKITVLTFRPQIAAIGDDLLALLGIAGDRTLEPTPASANLAGFRLATVFGTLAVLYRSMAAAPEASALTLAKRAFYEGLYHAARRTISATLDLNSDGTPDTPRHAAIPTLERA